MAISAVTVKNRFYKRYSRVLERLLETLAQMEEAGALAPVEKSAVMSSSPRERTTKYPLCICTDCISEYVNSHH